MDSPPSRRSFLKTAALGAVAMGAASTVESADPQAIQGFEVAPLEGDPSAGWKPVSDRKIRMGIVGYGACKFGARFYLQDHPNVEVVAVSDLFPDRCEALARECRCQKTYPSLEEMVKDDAIEAIFLATDAPGHCRHAIDALGHGKHVACAVPAVFGSLEEADRLFGAVNRSGRNYMMFETSYFHAELYAMRQIYRAGGFGKLIYSEGEYYHWSATPIASHKDWRVGMPPQWYPTHSNAYYIGVTDGVFTDVSCAGMPGILPHHRPENNRYKNPFGTEIALFRTGEGGMARMARSSDTPGHGGEVGRVRGQRGSMTGMVYQGLEKELPDLRRPPLPPRVLPGGHGGSHGYLANEFVLSILENRRPLIDIVAALNMTVAGIVAHDSAMRDGEWMKIPRYAL